MKKLSLTLLCISLLFVFAQSDTVNRPQIIKPSNLPAKERLDSVLDEKINMLQDLECTVNRQGKKLKKQVRYVFKYRG